MQPRIIGEHPLARDANGKLRSRIGTLFPSRGVLVTLPGIHATQRMAYLEILNRERQQEGLVPLTQEESLQEWEDAVDLITEGDCVLIRPDPDNMPLAFRADEMLQEIVPKHRIRFLFVVDERVRQAIKRRGECWRIAPLPKSRLEMIEMIAAAKIGIGCGEIYYYNRITGCRYLTFQEFAQLDALDDETLRRQLLEIGVYAAKVNRQGEREVRFFMVGRGLAAADFTAVDIAALDGPALRAAYGRLRQAFADAVDPDFRQDDPANADWRNRMYGALIGQEDDAVAEEELVGLSSEFFMQIHWLPGGRVEEGELIIDPIFEARLEPGADPILENLRDDKARGLIYNFVREYGDVDYVNVGRVIGSLSRRPAFYGRRDVYIAVLKQRGAAEEIVNIIRMQKWGIREHLDEGKSLLHSIIQSEEYTEYTLDRRLGCRQLGMNLPPRVTVGRLSEKYDGARADQHGIRIWTPYFQRDYIRGIATDKLPPHRYADEAFALQLARLLGRAAAANMIVGRCDLAGNVLFDDGDEVVIYDATGMPAEIIVADQTGTFADYVSDLADFALDYAVPVNRRIGMLPNPERFAEVYLDAFEERLLGLQADYHLRRRAFDTLFKHRPRDEAGSFAFRWEQVLRRLKQADPAALKQRIRQHVLLPACV